MIQKKLFDPTAAPPVGTGEGTVLGDRRDGAVYDYDERTVLAVNVALATGRPLLVRGPSGCGKSSLAPHVAKVQGWGYYEKVISSRTQAQDLLWEVDHLRRLQDAQAGQLGSGLAAYVRPGVLWWAFDHAGAKRQAERFRAAEGGKGKTDPNRGAAAAGRAVVLLDEIDKADPDVPNNLLVPLGSLEFEVEDTRDMVKTTEERAPLVVVTTNDERELPGAFLRRCVELELAPPDQKRLVRIGRKHFPEVSEADLDDVAGRVFSVADGQVTPSPAEYLDVVRAWRRLGEGFDPRIWEEVLRVAVRKPGRSAGRDA
jgi:MoxR-like ATPase